MNPSKTDATRVPEVLKNLKKGLGVTLLEVMLVTPSSTINKWIAEKEAPMNEQIKIILLLEYIWSMLRSQLTALDAKRWLVSHSEYLYGVPATELRQRPEDVYLATLNLVARGGEQSDVYENPRETRASQRRDTEPQADQQDNTDIPQSHPQS